jgi:glycosyltransferase involved in cell wall biosynthesis
MARVAVVLSSLGKGGAQRASLNLCEYLAWRGHAVDIVVLKRLEKEFPVPVGCRVVRLDVSRYLRAIGGVSSILIVHKYDVVYSALWHVNLLVTLACWIVRLRLHASPAHVASVHNNPAEIMRTESWIGSRLYFHWLATAARSVVCVSEGVTDALRRLRPLGGGQIVHLSNIVIRDTRSPSEQAGLPDLGPAVGTVLWIGRFEYQKNIPLLCEVVRTSTLKFTIVGEGEDQPQLEELVRELPDRVTLFPFQTDVRPFYVGALALLMTSRFEGQGMVLVEALEHGVPVVSTRCDYGPAEIIEDAVTGFLCPMDAVALSNALDVAANDPAFRSVFEGRRAASLERFAASTLGPHYERVLGIAGR